MTTFAVSDPTTTEQDGEPSVPEDVLEGILAAGENGGGAATAEQAGGGGEGAGGVGETLLPPFPPFPPIPLPTRQVRGRYRGATGTWQVELRVDVDGPQPTNNVSADFFATSGATTSYFGSFVVSAPTVTTTPTQIRIQGAGGFTWAAAAPVVRVTIPRVPLFAAPKPAQLEFLTAAGAVGASYLCAFGSAFLRTVVYEQDSVTGTVPFASYDTGSLPQPAGSPARVLTVAGAFAEAGIEMVDSGGTNVVPVGGAGAGPSPSWSDAELHAAMVNHFSRFSDSPQWQVWMLVATRYDDPGVRGIMFDASDAFPRQGAAVFHDAIQGGAPADRRAQLRTFVHEIGHAFNLLHSWQKGLATPPAPLGPNGGAGDLSWMNYAWRYAASPQGPSGEAAYWAAFPFRFTRDELVHLRHGFRRDVIMGGSAFGTGAAEVDPRLFDEPVVDHSRLALDLRARPSFRYGEPVVVELKLSATDVRGARVHGYLHPNDDLVTVAVRRPSGHTVVYRPMMRRCVDEARRVRLDAEKPAIYDSAYIGYGADGFLFDTPGTYTLRASYVAEDGSRVLSPVLRIRVRPPATAEDERVGELLLGPEQGTLLALLGSDAAALEAGNDALRTLVAEHPDHPLTVYARLVNGVNAERDFKDLGPDKVLRVRPADPTAAAAELRAVEDAATGGAGVDDITLGMAMRTRARAEAKAGDVEEARRVLDRMVTIFQGKGLRPDVVRGIRAEADVLARRLTEDAGPGDGRRRRGR